VTLSVTVEDLSTFLGQDSLDVVRADQMLGLAQDLCESIVSPLPDAAAGIVLSAAARGYSNPQGVSSETAGPYMVARPWAGVYLTKSERSALRRMGTTGGGAFSINPTPTTAGPNNQWAQNPLSPADVWNSPPYYGDWDQP